MGYFFKKGVELGRIREKNAEMNIIIRGSTFTPGGQRQGKVDLWVLGDRLKGLLIRKEKTDCHDFYGSVVKKN